MALLLIGCIAVLMPFTGTLLFAGVICVTTAPIRNRLLIMCRGRSSLAAALMSLLLLLMLVAPMALLSGSLAEGVESAIHYFKPILESGLPSDPPAACQISRIRPGHQRLLAQVGVQPGKR